MSVLDCDNLDLDVDDDYMITISGMFFFSVSKFYFQDKENGVAE